MTPAHLSRVLAAGAALVIAFSPGGATAAAKASAVKPAASYLATDQVLARRFATQEASMLGVPVKIAIKVKESPAVLLGPNENASTVPYDASGSHSGPATRCVITIAQATHGIGAGGKVSLTSSAANVLARATLAHEVFHCLEAQLATSLSQLASIGDWAIEGAATWVESDLVSGDADAREWWAEYLRTPSRPLFKRGYDGIGFFGHLSKTGTSPWSVFPAMFKQSGDTGAYQTAVTGDPGYLDSEASIFFRAIDLGPAWDPRGQQGSIANSNLPLTGTADRAAKPLDFASGTRKLRVAPYADAAESLTLKAPAEFVEVVVTRGYVRLHATDGGSVNAANVTSMLLCRRGAQCNCPGQTGLPAGAARFHDGDLAIAGGSAGALVRLSGMTREQACGSCLTGSWVTTSVSATGPTVSESGGAGIGLTVTPSSAARYSVALDYSRSRPLTITFPSFGETGTGTFGGTEFGTFVTTSPTQLSTARVTSNVTLTYTTSEGVTGTVAAPAVGSGGSIHYSCTKTNLTLTWSNSLFSSVVWSFARG